MFLSHRDLLKWCDRISVNFDGTSSATAQHVFHEVSGTIVSCHININHKELHFCSNCPNPSRLCWSKMKRLRVLLCSALVCM